MRSLIIITLFIAILLAGCSESINEQKLTPTPISTTHIPTPQATQSPTPVELEYGVKYKVLVVKVIDGDTIDVQFSDGSIQRVRMLGIDTPETTAERNKAGEYNGITDLDCLAEWGLKAKEFTKAKLEGDYAYIEFDPMAGFRGYYGRLLAYVYHPNQSADFTAELVKRGYARVYVEGKFAKEDEYLAYQNQAISSGMGLWGACAVTTPTPVPTETSGSCIYIYDVNYDAPGNDNQNPNGEYIILKNLCSNSVDLGGWRIEDDDNHEYTFPTYTINAGETVTLYIGDGTNGDGQFYWGMGRAILENSGDVLYLYDSAGRLVDEYSW